MVFLATERLNWLKHQIASGWRVEAPVIERAALYSSGGQLSAFEFILRHDHGCQVVAVPDCPELRAFLSEQALSVVSL
ncbi:MAG: hypothetical protein OHK0022_34450 [Roseiflexaceae bacterium]